MNKKLTLGFFLFAIIALAMADNSVVLETTPGSIVDPSSYKVKLVKDDPLSVECTVTPSVTVTDFVILEDTTGSMGSLINVLKTSFTTLYSQLGAQYTSPMYALAQYKDFTDPPPANPYQRLLDLTAPEVTIQNAINTLIPSGGADFPEATWNAIVTVSGDISFRASSRRALLVFNDAPGHEGAGYNNKDDAIAALNAKNIVPIFFTSDDHGAGTIAHYQDFIDRL
jgi:hypothetical protein